MDIIMCNLETLFNRGVLLLFLITLLVSAKVTASDDFSRYGLGADGLSLSAEKQFPAKFSKSQFFKDFEIDYEKHTSDKTLAEKPQDISGSALQLDVDYQDKTADISAPFHAFNTDLNNKFNNTSNEFKTSMGYRFKHATPEASFTYSPDSYGFGEYYNYGLGVAVPIKDVFSLETRYGWNKFDKQRTQGGINDYQDWSVGVSTTYKGMKLKVDYIDMNASEKSQECGTIFPCEGKTVFSIIKNF